MEKVQDKVDMKTEIRVERFGSVDHNSYFVIISIIGSSGRILVSAESDNYTLDSDDAIAVAQAMYRCGSYYRVRSSASGLCERNVTIDNEDTEDMGKQITNYLFLADGVLRINCSATSPESAECRLRQTFDDLEYLGTNPNFQPYTYERPKFSATHKPENLNVGPSIKRQIKPVLSPEEQVKASLAEAMRAQMGAS